MSAQSLSTRFYALVHPALPDERDVDAALACLDPLDALQVEAVLAQVPGVWAASPSLCFGLMAAAPAFLTHRPAEELHDWVQVLLDRFGPGDGPGLRAARRFLADTARYAASLGDGRTVRLSELRPRLEPYASALLGREWRLEPLPAPADDAPEAAFPGVRGDDERILLPEDLAILPTRAENALLCKLAVSCWWAFRRLGVLAALDDCTARFGEDNIVAQSLFHLLESVRALSLLNRELPGLMRESRPLIASLTGMADAAHPLFWIQAGLADLTWHPPADNALTRTTHTVLRALADAPSPADADAADTSPSPVLAACADVLPLLARRHPGCPSLAPLFFQGELPWRAPASARRSARERLTLRFLRDLSDQPESPSPHRQDAPDLRETRRFPAASDAPAGSEQADAASAATAAPARPTARNRAEERETSLFRYDEWDFRRKGFLRGWCAVREREVTAGSEEVLARSFERQQGRARELRRRFELLAGAPRLVRRQPEGEDIDLDALTEALADVRAGRAADSRVFVRSLKRERDIAALFLVDMSRSTEGWVAEVIRDSLLLLCEALAALKDRFGIYGFSGRTRANCEIFPAKRLDEPMNAAARRRIAGLRPQGYTRMAPAIRHLTRLLAQVEARTRLLFLLTDGKPEDLDDYNGPYAIEDTRHALIEARAAGLHPFCITVDRHGREYMAHMCGQYGHICIDSARLLPARLPAIYRAISA